MSNPMRTVSFKLPEPLDDTLTELARQRKSSRSALAREALEALAKRERRSVTTAVDELVDPLDGPADLSTHPKHMLGYGR
ncbi:MAG: CopG family ribbon-helix-helix protein [Polyangiaceae bacterium]